MCPGEPCVPVGGSARPEGGLQLGGSMSAVSVGSSGSSVGGQSVSLWRGLSMGRWRGWGWESLGDSFTLDSRTTQGLGHTGLHTVKKFMSNL